MGRIKNWELLMGWFNVYEFIIFSEWNIVPFVITSYYLLNIIAYLSPMIIKGGWEVNLQKKLSQDTFSN